MKERAPEIKESFQIAGCRVDPSTLRVSCAGQDTRLESKAMQMLVYLAENAGRVVSRNELEGQIWSGRVVTGDVVTNTIAKLRRVFGDDARNPHVIETVPKTGYRLIAQVTPASDEVVANGASVNIASDTSAAGVGRYRYWAIGIILVMLPISAWVFLTWDDVRLDQPKPLSGKPRVAILPFYNLGKLSEQDYFTNGITADLITDLSKVSGLFIIAPGTVFAYRNSKDEPGKIATELGVDYVVSGTVQRSADRLRINVQIIEPGLEHALWGERYNGAVDEVFKLQDEITQAVVEVLEIELAPTERAILAKRPTASVAAYDFYLRGLEDHGHRSRAQNLSARAHFQRAIEIDPSFARAYGGLALTYSREAIDGWTADPYQALEKTVKLAENAATMDPSLPQVHFVKGMVDVYRRKHTQAIKAAQRAVELDPNYADAHALNALILNYSGLPEKAEASLKTATHLNPRAPATYLGILGEIRLVQRRFDEASTLFEKVLEINPNYSRVRMLLAIALVHAGFQDRAEWEAAELLILLPDITLTRLEFSFPYKDPRDLDVMLDGLRAAGVQD